MRPTAQRGGPLLFGALLGLASCAEERINLALPDLPEDIDWAALVLEDQGGVLAGTTHLLPVREGRIQVEIPGDRGSSVVLYAYRDADLDPRIPREAQQLTQPLQFARIDQPVLPAPSLQVRAELEDEATFRPDTVLRDLTAPWLPPCDPQESVMAGATALVSCANQNCVPIVTQTGCQVRFDLRGGCGLGIVDVKLLPGGGAQSRATPDILGVCDGVEPRSDAVLGVNCVRPGLEDCRIDLYPVNASAHLDVRQTKLVPDAPEVQDGQHLLGGLALLSPTELVVSVADDPACTAGGNHRLLFLDRTSLEVVRAEPTPYCIQLMHKDPMGDGFVGLTREPVSAVRYSAQGVLLDRRLVEGLPDTPNPVPYYWSFSADGRRAVVWVTTWRRSLRLASAFLEINWADLSVAASTVMASSDNFPVALLSNAFVLLDDDRDTLRYFDRVGGTELHTVSLSSGSVTNRSLWGMKRLGNSDELVIFIQSNRDTLGVVDAERRLSFFVASQLRQPARTGAMLPGPNPRLLIVGGDTAQAAELVLFDPEARYFLHGATPLNIDDIPADAVSDGLDPHVFVHFRDTTRVVRARATE